MLFFSLYFSCFDSAISLGLVILFYWSSVLLFLYPSTESQGWWFLLSRVSVVDNYLRGLQDTSCILLSNLAFSHAQKGKREESPVPGLGRLLIKSSLCLRGPELGLRWMDSSSSTEVNLLGEFPLKWILKMSDGTKTFKTYGALTKCLNICL